MVHAIIVIVLFSLGIGVHFIVKPRPGYEQAANTAEEVIEEAIKYETTYSIDFDDLK